MGSDIKSLVRTLFRPHFRHGRLSFRSEHKNIRIQTNKHKTTKLHFALSTLWPSVTHSCTPTFFSSKQKHAHEWPTVCLRGQYCYESTKSVCVGRGCYLALCCCSPISWQLVDSKSAKKKQLCWHSISSHESFLSSESGCRVTAHRVHRMCLWQRLLSMCELNNFTFQTS